MMSHNAHWPRVWPDTERLAAGLLILFAFSAWSLTGLANVALALLAALFVHDLPRHWPQLRRDPGLWLLFAVLLVTSLLALLAIWRFPATAIQQIDAIGSWNAPFLFVIIAWWLRADLRLMHQVLLAALLGLTLGILRKLDLSQLDAVLHGDRYDHAGTAILGLGFLISIAMLGLFLYRERLLTLSPWRWFGGLIWTLLILFFAALLLVMQARGAMFGLMLAGIAAVRVNAGHLPFRGRWRLPFVLLTLLLATTTLLWMSRERLTHDLNALVQTTEGASVRYDSSLGTRLNLYRVGLNVFAARPLIGWGPGSSATKLIIPARLLAVAPADLEQAPAWSHLHSIPLELLVRFGLVGAAIGVLLLILLIRAWRHLDTSRADPMLADFLRLIAILTLWFSVYDFRLVNLDLRFFLILFLGILYSFSLFAPDPAFPEAQPS